jgi:peptidoglycan hydrolase-like protein with peptidoglycan-binding domain
MIARLVGWRRWVRAENISSRTPHESEGIMLRAIFLAAGLWMQAGAAMASGLVLILANERYPTLGTARNAGLLLEAERPFAMAGFRTDVASDLSAPAMRAALARVSDDIDALAAERVILVYSGLAVHGPSGIWLLGTDAQRADVTGVESTAIRLETLLAIASELQGGAMVAVADLGFPSRPGAGLQRGLPAAIDVPQGVTLVSGPAPALTAFLRDVAQPGTNLAQAAERHRGLRMEGFTPRFLPFLPVGAAPTETVSTTADQIAWEEASAASTAEGYRAYLAQFPAGLFAAAAREALQQIESSPDRVEAALNLTRDERRAIQRDLTLLGFTPRGIDGIFGRGTRAAITAWQGRGGYPQTGFLDRDQIFQLATQGARRAAELEAEARERQLEQERQDRTFWRDSGAGRDEVGMRAYLQRFPDGILSSIARERLGVIDAERQALTDARDSAAFARAEELDTAASYDAYLREYPRGAYAEIAAARIVELSEPARPDRLSEAEVEAAARAEAAMGLPQLSRALIERRLASLGFEPGLIDGQFDENTRRAIRRYQRAADLVPTGYLTESMVSRLLAEGIFQLFE